MGTYLIAKPIPYKWFNIGKHASTFLGQQIHVACGNTQQRCSLTFGQECKCSGWDIHSLLQQMSATAQTNAFCFIGKKVNRIPHAVSSSGTRSRCWQYLIFCWDEGHAPAGRFTCKVYNYSCKYHEYGIIESNSPITRKCTTPISTMRTMRMKSWTLAVSLLACVAPKDHGSVKTVIIMIITP